MKSYDYEEEFHRRGRRELRKERKRVQKRDRSKFKKSDQDQLLKQKKKEIPSLPRGRVVAITGEGAYVDEQGRQYLCSLKGSLKKERHLVKNPIAVGDWVRFSPTKEGEGSIAYIEERRAVLARTDISGKKEQLIAVNVDQLLIAVSVVEPALKPALIDRYLIAAEKGDLHPILVINKVDLLEGASEEEHQAYRDFLLAYEPVGIPILSVSANTGVGIEALKAILQNKTSVFSGQSGVGKSSLLNACFGLTLKTGKLALKTQKGSHTTTTAELLTLPGGGYCVDTPGIRSFGIWKLHKEDVSTYFCEIADFAKKCRFPDCMHREEPGCAVQRALKGKKISPLRYASYLSLLEEGNKQTWD